MKNELNSNQLTFLKLAPILSLAFYPLGLIAVYKSSRRSSLWCILGIVLLTVILAELLAEGLEQKFELFVSMNCLAFLLLIEDWVQDANNSAVVIKNTSTIIRYFKFVHTIILPILTVAFLYSHEYGSIRELNVISLGQFIIEHMIILVCYVLWIIFFISTNIRREFNL